MIDGVRGTSNFVDGSWQGMTGGIWLLWLTWERCKTFRNLAPAFCKTLNRGFGCPAGSISKSQPMASNFVPALSLANEVSDSEYGAIVKDFVGTIKPQRRALCENHCTQLRQASSVASRRRWRFVDLR